MDEKTINRIVLTGGPCAGKTSALCYLRQKLLDLGYSVFIMSEVATELINSGFRPDNLGGHFQEQLLLLTLEKEKRWLTMTDKIEATKIVIIYDRGTMDGRAYVSEAQFEMMLGKLDLTVVDIRDKYDGVIFLRSVAFDRPELYSCLNNEARREDLETAKDVDDRTLKAWTGHPHLHIIDNSTNFEDKLKRILQAVCHILGIPIPMEIERKYLIIPFGSMYYDLSVISSSLQTIEITQYYLQGIHKPGEERIRCRGQHGAGEIYFHCIKQEIDFGIRKEQEREIERRDYIDMLSRADTTCGKINKRRTCFVYENQYFELDFFISAFGLILLEIELTNIAHTVVLPPLFRKHATDVTGDPYYSNYHIAKRTT